MRDRTWALASLAPMQSQCKAWYETTQGFGNAGIGRNGAVGTRTNTSSRGFQGARAFGKPVRSCMSSVVEPCAARPSPRFAGLPQRPCVSSCRHLDRVRLPSPSTLEYRFVSDKEVLKGYSSTDVSALCQEASNAARLNARHTARGCAPAGWR